MVPTSIQVPSTQPADIASMAMYMTVMMQQLQQWIALAAKVLNGFGDYSISVDDQGRLIATSSNGVVSILAVNFEQP